MTSVQRDHTIMGKHPIASAVVRRCMMITSEMIQNFHSDTYSFLRTLFFHLLRTLKISKSPKSNLFRFIHLFGISNTPESLNNNNLDKNNMLMSTCSSVPF